MSILQIAIAIDQLGNALLGGYADETISARAHRNRWTKTERIINWLFRDDLHCAAAYISEMTGAQNASTYRKEQQS